MRCPRSHRTVFFIVSILLAVAGPRAASPTVANGCNAVQSLQLLKKGQEQSVNGEKSKGIDTQVLGCELRLGMLQRRRPVWRLARENGKSIRGHFGRCSDGR